VSVSIEVFLLFCDGFYRQGPGDPLMLGKPHEISFPEKAFTVKDGKSLNSERECLNLASILTVSSTVNRFCWPAIATDSCRDVFPSKSTRYGSFVDSWR
jgi:hypothetical protein